MMTRISFIVMLIRDTISCFDCNVAFSEYVTCSPGAIPPLVFNTETVLCSLKRKKKRTRIKAETVHLGFHQFSGVQSKLPPLESVSFFFLCAVFSALGCLAVILMAMMGSLSIPLRNS
jgi:hypothetical protein